jgi:hypothetical protein
VYDHHVDVHLDNELAFRFACDQKQTEIIEWFINEYRYTPSSYYYYNLTGYILNHKPLDHWKSCIILDCPIIYYGKLNKPAITAYMETLRIPKSARSRKNDLVTVLNKYNNYLRWLIIKRNL